MSLLNSIRIPLVFPHVDVFTFGESSLFGYDSLDHCLIVLSLIDLNNSNIRLYLSSSPTFPVRKLILNEDETILALISDKTAYLVYIPQSTNSPSKDCYLCPVNVIPPSIPNLTSLNNLLIDFIWLSPIHFILVNSIPSSSECHLYLIQPSKYDQIEYIQTFSVELSSTIKEKTNLILNKKNISLHQPSNIIKLDLAKRKEQDLILILLFAMKDNGDFFIMEIDQNQLKNNELRISSSFVGPIDIFPSRFDNYGADYGHSCLLCLSCSEYAIIVFTSDKCEINECIVLNPTINKYSLFTIDSINFLKNPIKSMIIDKLNSNIYYVWDSLSNIYSIEISWINQIQVQQKQIETTNIKHLIKSNDPIQQIGLIQTNNKGQWLAIITKTLNNQQKELILFRPHLLSLSSKIKSHSSIQSNKTDLSNSSSEFLDRIRSILHHDQSLLTNISNSDFETNLVQLIRIFSEEYVKKQEKVRIELENKQRYLYDFQQTQFIAYQELDQKFQQIQQTIQILNQQYQQEYSRRKDLLSNVDDLLSVIEEHTPIQSNAEILMHQQLKTYQIKINSLKEKIFLLKQFISSQNFNQNQQQVDQSSLETIQRFIQYFKNEIDQMKQKLHTVNQNE